MLWMWRSKGGKRKQQGDPAVLSPKVGNHHEGRIRTTLHARRSGRAPSNERRRQLIVASGPPGVQPWSELKGERGVERVR